MKLSAAGTTISRMTIDVWGGVPAGWRVEWQPVRRLGECRWADRVIVLADRLSEWMLPVVLVHEVVHAERGPSPRWARVREEETVRQETARRLIDVRALGEALAARPWDPAGVAEELGAPVDVVLARLRGLHPAELAYLARRLEEVRSCGC